MIKEKDEVGHVRTHHHKVELTVGWADGLKHKGDLSKLSAGQPWKRGWNSATKTEIQMKTKYDK